MITFSKIGKMGRLGNEMFQFATLCGVHKKTGFPIHINWELGKKYFHLEFPPLERPTIKHTFKEKHSSQKFDKSIFSIKDNTDLHGYFQTSKYFDFCRSEIVSLFEPNETIKQSVNDLLDSYDVGKPFIVLHVRGSDYLSQKEIRTTGGIPSTQYYVDAIKHICEKRKKRESDFTLLAFSDDEITAKQVLGQINRVSYVSSSPSTALFTMTKVQNLVISPSTFAWWGAYLNQVKGLLVCCPKNWRTPKNRQSKPIDIIEKNWLQIEVKELFTKPNVFSLLKVKLIHLLRLFGIKS